MPKKRSVLITGATGFLGSELLKLLLQERNIDVYMLIRGDTLEEAKGRLAFLLKRIFSTGIDKYLKKCRILNSDIESFGQHKDPSQVYKVSDSISEIFHCAAITGFDISLKSARDINVCGTKNILNFAKQCKKLQKFNYISTTFIAGNFRGVFSEGDFNLNQKFNNYYEQSKYEAEELVRMEINDRYKTLIFRPGILIGNYSTGQTTNFKMFYEPLRIFSREIMKSVPADPGTIHNLTPADIAAKAIYVLSLNARDNNLYHILSHDNIVSGEFMQLAAQYFDYRNPDFVPFENFDMGQLTPVQLRMIKAYIPYFNYGVVFKSKKTEDLLKRHGFSYPPINKPFLNRLFKYCDRVGFIKKRSKLEAKT